MQYKQLVEEETPTPRLHPAAVLEVDLSDSRDGEKDGQRQSPQPPKQKGVTLAFSKPLWCIIGCEFCERFCYYGFRAILGLYLATQLQYSESEASAILHMFIVLAYFFPLFGGWVSDSYWGKYKTILWLSWVHLLGNAMLAICAIPLFIGSPPVRWPTVLSLIITAIGVGGIKPCVSAFAGDQFHPSDLAKMSSFYSVFYLSINAGALLGQFISPLMRANVGYSAAFAMPALLMFIALLAFVYGRKVGYVERPPTGNVLGRVCRVIWTGFRRRTSLPPHRRLGSDNTDGAASVGRRAHWLDGARPIHGDEAVDDCIALFRACIIMAPIPVFWALYDQQGSRWTFQATHMDLSIGSLHIEPDMVQNINAFLILVLTPLFDQLVYPGLRRLGFAVTSLQKMTAGMLCAALAFVASGLIQSMMDARPEHSVSVLWQIPQYVILTCGEVLLSITGLEFSYTCAPASMKSVVMSLWLLTSSIGNMLDAVIMFANPFHSGAAEFFFFAALQVVVMFIFIVCIRLAGADLSHPPVRPDSYHRSGSDADLDLAVANTTPTVVSGGADLRELVCTTNERPLTRLSAEVRRSEPLI